MSDNDKEAAPGSALNEGSQGEEATNDPTAGAGEGNKDSRKAELEKLFEDWSTRRESEFTVEPAFGEAVRDSSKMRDPVVWRGAFTAIIVLMSAGLMYFTQDDFFYWLKAGDAPIDIGNVADHYRAQKATLDVPTNSFVKADGLFVTHELRAAKTKDGEAIPKEGSRKYFICPMYDIMVQTEQPLPRKAWSTNVTIDGAFIDLINRRRAFPQDLTVNMAVTGRLFKLRDAPTWARRVVDNYYVKQLRVSFDPKRAYIILDGENPAKYVKYAYFWGFAILAPFGPLALLILALRRRKRDLEAVGAPEA